MKTKLRVLGLGIAAVCLSTVVGCQTWNMEAGITLPSPYYLRHPPQYFPPSEPYPLPKELRSQEEAAKQFFDAQRNGGQ